MKKETILQRDTTNAALAAVMLRDEVRKELDKDFGPGYAEAHPVEFAACINAAALLHMASLLPLAMEALQALE